MTLPRDGCFVAAEAIFGSAARGDCDSMSDRDILLVDDDVSLLRARACELEGLNWSVATYTFRKLRHLASSGALFIQHLKLEAQIIHDAGGLLGRLLQEFRPRTNYSGAIADNARLALISGTVPDSSRGLLLAADILFVAIRNFGVLTLAEQDIYLFSYGSILAALEERGAISRGGTRALTELRSLKGLYRAGKSDLDYDVRSAVSQALAVLPSAHFPKQLCLLRPQAILGMPGPRAAESGYLHLRDLERRLVALQCLDAACISHEQLTRLAHWISSPRSYAGMAKRLGPALRERLATLYSATVAGAAEPTYGSLTFLRSSESVAI